MLYNIRIKSPKGGLQVILGVNDFDLNRLKESWQKGHEDVTINGTKVYLQNADFIKIYDVSKKIDPTSVSRVQEQVSIYARTMNKGIIDNSVLREYGEDVTAMFIKGGWGERIDKDTNESNDEVIEKLKSQLEQDKLELELKRAELELNEKLSSKLEEAIRKEKSRDVNRRYWAGGFGKHDGAYERLARFKTENYWQALDYDEDSNQGVAEAAWRLFREIKVGDWFLIKGYGGGQNMNVHYIGEVIKKDEDAGRLDFKSFNIRPYSTPRPLEEGAGNWFLTLLEVHRPDIITDLFFKVNNPERNDNFHADSKNFWLLSYNPQNWPPIFYLNESYWFHKQDFHPDFMKENLASARVGDLVFGLSNLNGTNSKVVFRITQELAFSTQNNGEVIKLKPIHISEAGIPLVKLLENASITGEFKEYSFKTGFYKCTPEVFTVLLDLFRIAFSDLVDNPKSGRLARVFNDIDHDKTEDQLEFEADIEALASLVAYTQTAPPLAIGLFGNWGTGKSYFMHHLAKRIKRYAESDDGAFHRHVCEIHFNTWHYIDSNLWASLVNHIFESIHNFFKQTEEETADSEFDKLFAQLKSTEKLKTEKEKEKKAVEDAILNLQGQINHIEGEKKNKIDNLKIPTSEIIEKLVDDSTVKPSFDKLQDITVGPIIQNLSAFEAQLNQYKQFWFRVSQAFRNIKKYKCKEWIFFIVFPTLIFLAPWVLLSFYSEHLGRWNLFLASFATKALSVLSAGLLFLNPVNRVLSSFESLHQSLQELKRQKLSEKTEKERELEAIHNEYKDRLNTLASEIAVLITQKSILETEVHNIYSGKRLYNWIAEKTSGNDYKKHLGLISTIRKDFEMLDALMLDQVKAQKLNHSEKSLEGPKIKIDRIVLFIDDLDRCPEDRVIEVLQAVHLLMSFQLFVVVVGVDSRWLKNAIEYHYKKEMQGSTETSKESKMSARDYLEKIFQITFHLRAMSKSSSESYINHLLNDRKGNETLVDESRTSVNTDTEKLNKEEVEQSQFEQEEKQSTFKPQVIPTEVIQRPIISSKELELMDSEKAYMALYSNFVSHSPRTLKRFVNTYRLLRVHQDFKAINPNEEGCEVAIFLMALQIGGHIENQNWIENILTTNDEVLFKDVEDLQAIVAKVKETSSVMEYQVLKHKSIVHLVNRFGTNN